MAAARAWAVAVTAVASCAFAMLVGGFVVAMVLGASVVVMSALRARSVAMSELDADSVATSVRRRYPSMPVLYFIIFHFI